MIGKIIDKQNKKEYEIHPLCMLFPWMDDKVKEVLKEDMLKHGQRDSIKLFKGKVLDGKNRLRVCVNAGLEPKLEHLPDDTNIVAYVKAVGLCRRDLTPDQRIDIAEQLLEYKYELEGRKEKVEKAKQDLKQKALIEKNEIAEITKEANTTKETVEAYRAVKAKSKEEEVAKKELQAIKNGKQTIKQAYEKVFPKPKKVKPKRPKKKSKQEIEKELVETKTELISLENRFKRVIDILKEYDVWKLVKNHLYPILEEVPALQPTIEELRKAELI